MIILWLCLETAMGQLLTSFASTADTVDGLGYLYNYAMSIPINTGQNNQTITQYANGSVSFDYSITNINSNVYVQFM